MNISKEQRDTIQRHHSGQRRPWEELREYEYRTADGEHDHSAYRRARTALLWEHVFMPERFRDTDFNHPGLQHSKAQIDRILGWKFSPTGLLCAGPSGTGKTRALIHLAKRLECVDNLDVTWFWQTELTRLINRGSTPDDFLEMMQGAASSLVLFWDDFGKFAAMGSRNEMMLSEIEAMLDERYRRNLPTLVSTNMTTEALEETFGKLRAEPVLRRLIETTETIRFSVAPKR